MKYLLFTEFSLNTHWAALQPQKRLLGRKTTTSNAGQIFKSLLISDTEDDFKVGACSVNYALYMAFWDFFSFATVLLVKLIQTLIVFNSNLCQSLLSSFGTTPSEFAMLFNWNLSKRPILGPIVNQYLVLCTSIHNFDSLQVDLFWYLIFYQETNASLKDWAEQFAGLWYVI